jgi:hypothetical protein
MSTPAGRHTKGKKGKIEVLVATPKQPGSEEERAKPNQEPPSPEDEGVAGEDPGDDESLPINKTMEASGTSESGTVLSYRDPKTRGGYYNYDNVGSRVTRKPSKGVVEPEASPSEPIATRNIDKPITTRDVDEPTTRGKLGNTGSPRVHDIVQARLETMLEDEEEVSDADETPADGDYAATAAILYGDDNNTPEPRLQTSRLVPKLKQKSRSFDVLGSWSSKGTDNMGFENTQSATVIIKPALVIKADNSSSSTKRHAGHARTVSTPVITSEDHVSPSSLSSNISSLGGGAGRESSMVTRHNKSLSIRTLPTARVSQSKKRWKSAARSVMFVRSMKASQGRDSTLSGSTSTGDQSVEMARLGGRGGGGIDDRAPSRAHPEFGSRRSSRSSTSSMSSPRTCGSKVQHKDWPSVSSLRRAEIMSGSDSRHPTANGMVQDQRMSRSTGVDDLHHGRNSALYRPREQSMRPRGHSSPSEDHFVEPSNTSLPVKDVLKGIYRITRLKTAYGLMIWTTFLALYVSVFALMYDTHQGWEQISSLEDLFVDEEFTSASFKKNWNDIMTFGELWDWLEGPLYNGLYNDKWYNHKTKEKHEQGYIIDQTMKLVGGVRIRQHKVARDSCNSRRFIKYIKDDQNQPERCAAPYTVCPFDRLDGSCLSEFRPQSADWLEPLLDLLNLEHTSLPRDAYVVPRFSPWKDKNFSLDELPKRYIMREMDSDLASGIPTTSGLFTYGKWGLYQDLPSTNGTEARRLLNEMKEELWIDEATRGFGVSFTVYNTMTRMATTSRFTVEFLPSGRVLLRTKFHSFPVVLYGGSNYSFARTVLEVFQALFFLYYVQKEARKNWRLGGRAYWLKRKTTLLEVGVLTIFLAYFVLLYTFVAEITGGKAGQEFHIENEQYRDYFNLGDRFNDARLAGGLGMLVACVKVIKYLSINKQALLLIKTIFAAKNTLVMFSLFFCTLWFGVSWLAVMAYGSRVYQFHDLAGSMASVFRMMLGDYQPYDRLFSKLIIVCVMLELVVSLVTHSRPIRLLLLPPPRPPLPPHSSR